MPSRRPEEYLELAQQAEKAAEQAETAAAKNSWLAISQEYRVLAAEKLRQSQGDRDPSGRVA